MMRLYLATGKGLVVGEYEAGESRVVNVGLAEQAVTSVIAREGVVLAGSRQGVFRSDDDGRSWRSVNEGLTTQYVRWLAYHPAVSDLEFAGTEPAGLFVSTDGAESWQGKGEVADLRDRYEWFLPYSPEAGCVRGFAFQGERLYAAVEVGGLLASDDRGKSWGLVPGSDGIPKFARPQVDFIHPDVHSVVVHPEATEMVYCPTGGGFYVSEDSGKTWELRYDDCYCRAVWVDPADPAHLVLGPAGSVDRNGRIEESVDGGRTWQIAHAGTDAPWPNNMVERFQQIGDALFAVLSHGQLLTAKVGKWEWRQIFEGTAEIRDISPMG